jgi:hypothetical protein
MRIRVEFSTGVTLVKYERRLILSSDSSALGFYPGWVHVRFAVSEMSLDQSVLPFSSGFPVNLHSSIAYNSAITVLRVVPWSSSALSQPRSSPLKWHLDSYGVRKLTFLFNIIQLNISFSFSSSSSRITSCSAVPPSTTLPHALRNSVE